jgi:hypothetical protein
VQPGVGALDHPALRSLRVAGAPLAAWAFLDDPWFDPALPERGADVFGVVAAIGEQLVWSVAAAAPQRRDQIDDRDRMAAVMIVRRTQDNGQRGAVAVAG